jgi:hypothetical protein
VAADHPGDGARDDRTGQWLGLGPAAQELGLTRSAVYRRIRAGTLSSRPRGNRGLEVFVAPDDRDHSRDDARDDRAVIGHDRLQARVEELLERAVRAEGELAAKDALVAELRQVLDQERTRGDRLETALAEARRPWLARVLDGLRRKGG